MNNFSEFVNSQNNENIKNNKEQKNNKQYSNEELSSMIDKYSSLSNDKLMQEFLKLTLEKKKRGELTSAELNKIRETISPMLNDQQKNYLNELLHKVEDV